MPPAMTSPPEFSLLAQERGRFDRSTADWSAILFDVTNMLRPLAEIQAILDADRRWQPKERRLILRSARRLWGSTEDDDG